MNKRRKTVTAVIFATLLAFTTSCAQLPKEGVVKTGPNLEAGLETDYLYYSPSGPTEDASQEEILLGFINAGTGPQNDYAAAREYLTSGLNAEWNPNQEVLVQAGKPIITMSDDDTASVVVPISAVINSRGEYEAQPMGATRVVDVGFSSIAGNWRISSAPNLTMVIRPVFDVVFKAYSIFFFDSQQKRLVPDVRWFPSRASTSTRLVNALLGGPSPWLKNAVRSAIPSGTRLNLSSVTVADGIANVDLSARALSASAEEKQRLQTQIRETLLQLGSVYSVRVTIERAAILQPTNQLSGSQFLITKPLAMVDSSLVYLDDSTASEIGNSRKLISEVGASDFATNADQKIVALAGTGGIYIGRLDRVTQDPVLLASGTAYLAPIVDAQGFTWVVPKAGSRSVLVFDAQGNQVDFDSRWLGGLNRLSFALSSEGSRVVVVTGNTGTNGPVSKTRVAAIIRDATGVPLYVDDAINPVSSGTVFSATWLDGTRIGFLESQASTNVQPIISMIGGDSKILQTLSTGSAIIGSGQANQIYILGNGGEVFQYRGSNWLRIRDQVTALRFPGN